MQGLDACCLVLFFAFGIRTLVETWLVPVESLPRLYSFARSLGLYRSLLMFFSGQIHRPGDFSRPCPLDF